MSSTVDFRNVVLDDPKNRQGSYELFKRILEEKRMGSPSNKELRNDFANSLIRMAAHIAYKRSKQFAETAEAKNASYNVMDFDTCFSAAMEAVVKILNNPAQYNSEDKNGFYRKCRSLMHKEIVSEWRYLTHRGRADNTLSLDTPATDFDEARHESSARILVPDMNVALAVRDLPDRGTQMAEHLHDRVVPTVKRLNGAESKTTYGLEALVQACREHVNRKELGSGLIK